IAQGDNVVVVGTSSGSGVAATRIVDSGSTAAAAGLGGRSGTRAGLGIDAGQVTAINGSSLTITESDGTTVTVTTSSSTAVTTTQKVSVSALSPGETVRVAGTTNSDGSITASSVQEGTPGAGGGLGRGFLGPFGPGGAPAGG
ncbi:MAG TPA: DUF5666 domain-containing protein, partial [Acidimicrobiales bacterium]|nr:DUF5666 domain-containing protein [Acidimicrobiales bacterium]